jgi:hypothetical protein
VDRRGRARDACVTGCATALGGAARADSRRPCAADLARWTSPIDRLAATYLRDHRVARPEVVSDALFVRRAYLDVWGLLPSRDEVTAFTTDRSPGKREALVTRLLADGGRYADHWMSFGTTCSATKTTCPTTRSRTAAAASRLWLHAALETTSPTIASSGIS